MELEKLIRALKKKQSRYVADMMLLIIHIERNRMCVAKAARTLNRVRSWGVKQHRRYRENGIDGLRSRPRTGLPSKVYKEIMKKVRRLMAKISYWEAEEYVLRPAILLGTKPRRVSQNRA